MEPMVIAGVVAALLFFYAGWKVYAMKKSFEARNGSYDVIKLFLPEWLWK